MELYQQPIFDLSVPFMNPIPGQLVEGTVISVSGRVLPDADRFSLNLQYGSDIALHFNPRYEEGSGYVVHNTRKNCKWGLEEVKSEIPFPRGQIFALQILVTLSSYKIIANGKPFSEFKHRVPLTSVDGIFIHGMVELNSVQYIQGTGNWLRSPQVILLQHGFRAKSAKKELYQQPIFNPSVPFINPIPGRLVEGTWITVSGRVLPDADGFSLNLQYGSDIALHFNLRYEEGSESVVHNTRQKCEWGLEEVKSENPFPRGQIFALQILVTPSSYKISTNGKPFSEFEHRVPLTSVDGIFINGMVELSLVSLQYIQPEIPLGSLRVPYKSIIDGGLKPGKVIIIQGVLNSDGMEIALRHKNGIAFFYSVRLDESVVMCNSYEEGKWGEEELHEIMPFEMGEDLQITIVCHRDHYEVFVNGEQTQTFSHRFTKLEDVDVVEVSGDVELSFVQP